MWRVRVAGLGLGKRVFGGIADEEGHVVVDDEGDVEAREGFWGGAEFGSGEVPEEVGVGGEFFGTVFFPEEEGSYVVVEGEGGGVRVGWGI